MKTLIRKLLHLHNYVPAGGMAVDFNTTNIKYKCTGCGKVKVVTEQRDINNQKYITA